MSNEIEFERVGEAPSNRRRHPLLESAKRKKYFVCRAKRGRHFVHKSHTNNVLLASPSISLDKNATFIAANSQALQIHCFQRLRSISFNKNNTSGAECSQTQQMECFWRQVFMFFSRGTSRNLSSGFENGLIQIWTERCPNEAIWKQVCHEVKFALQVLKPQ